MPAPTDIPLGAPVWLDLQSSDTARSIEFYTGVFGWTHEQAGTDYTTDYEGALAFCRDAFGWTTTMMSDSKGFRMSTFSAGGDPLAGIFDASGYAGVGQTARWMPYFGVEDALLTIIQVM